MGSRAADNGIFSPPEDEEGKKSSMIYLRHNGGLAYTRKNVCAKPSSFIDRLCLYTVVILLAGRLCVGLKPFNENFVD